MKTVNRDNIWFPAILDDFLFENRLDAPNKIETFRSPKVNIMENLSNFVIELAVPGLEKKNFSIEFEESSLRIKSQPVSEQEEISEEKGNASRYHRREFNYDRFSRSFKLPENINTEDIQASYTNGILRVTLPKQEEKKPSKRMVEIS